MTDVGHSWVEAATGLVATTVVGVFGFVWRLGNRVTTLEAQSVATTAQLDRVEDAVNQIRDHLLR